METKLSVKKLSESKFTMPRIYEAVAPKKEGGTSTSLNKSKSSRSVGTFTIRINLSIVSVQEMFPSRKFKVAGGVSFDDDSMS